MKVYVDELPKSCEECPMCRSGSLKLQKKGRYVEAHTCVFGQYKYQTIDDEIDTCPLKSLTDYTKQVRKEVCGEIRDLAGNYFELPYCDNCGATSNDDVILTGKDLTEILNQIQSKDSWEGV